MTWSDLTWPVNTTPIASPPSLLLSQTLLTPKHLSTTLWKISHYQTQRPLEPHLQICPVHWQLWPIQPHLLELEYDNNLTLNSITSAMWLKCPDHCFNTQTTVFLKVICSTPEMANHLLSKRVYVAGHSITVTKDLHKSIHCNKCQGYGHIHAACQGPKTCVYCTSKSYFIAECPLYTPSACISCWAIAQAKIACTSFYQYKRKWDKVLK